VLLALILGAVDFGRVMQARVTSESSAKVGAQWGASHLQNAMAALPPAYALAGSPKKCGTASGLDYGPNCNILARACAEAAGLPSYSGGSVITGDGGDDYQVCSSGTSTNVCTPSASQSNPFMTIAWSHAGVAFTPAPGLGAKPAIGDTVTVTGVYCFKTFFPGPMSVLTWSSAATYSVQP
jgi:hypothetical protein